MLKTNTFKLKSFNGLYGSKIDLNEMCNTFEIDEIDANKTIENVGRAFFKKWYEVNESWINELGITLEFSHTTSPKYYNYSTDEVWVKATFDKKRTIEKILDFILENKDTFEIYIEREFTPRDGYVPFYDNSLKKWFNKYINKIHKERYREVLSSIIDAFDLNSDEDIELIEYNIFNAFPEHAE